jgi:hypothetical protein
MAINTIPMRKSMDSVKHPRHYTSIEAKCASCGAGIECIDVTKHFNFCLGNAIKYVWRADTKGNDIEDLRKAIQYLEFEIQRRETSQGDTRDKIFWTCSCGVTCPGGHTTCPGCGDRRNEQAL